MVASIVPLTDDQREIVLHHYHMVDVTVSSLASAYPHIDRDDLRSWASIGLMKAVQHYDPDKGCSFTTHSYRMMRWEVSTGVMTNTRTRYESNLLLKYNKAKKHLEHKYDRQVNLEEVLDFLDVRSEAVRQSFKRTVTMVNTPVLDCELRKEGKDGNEFGDQIAEGVNDLTPDKLFELMERKRNLWRMLRKVLSERDLLVFIAYSRGYTYDEIRTKILPENNYKLFSRQRIHQIVVSGCERVRSKFRFESNLKKTYQRS